MNVKLIVADRDERARLVAHRPSGASLALAALATLLLAPVPGQAADPAGPGAAGASHAVKLESVPGSGVKRVTLTAKAAERLGIETGKVDEEPIVRRQMFGGLVTPPLEKPPPPKPSGGGLFGGFQQSAAGPARPGAGLFGGAGQPGDAAARQPGTVTTAPAPARAGAGEAWVLVTLSPGEWDRLAQDKPARVLPLATREEAGKKEVTARPSGLPPLEDTKRSMLRLYYVVPGKDHGLTLNRRVRVELQLAGKTEKQKVVPYGAVYYDAKGAAWVYVAKEPLVFERQRIGVNRIVGDLAVLAEGPPVGTPVVTVGAAMLYGAEIFGK